MRHKGRDLWSQISSKLIAKSLKEVVAVTSPSSSKKTYILAGLPSIEKERGGLFADFLDEARRHLGPED
jgi:hypothetical protein